MCALPSGEVQCNRFGAAGLWEEWTVHVLAQPSPSVLIVGLRSCHGLWLCAEPCGRVLANRPTLDKWEEWTIERQANGRHAFRSTHGKYLCCCLAGAFFGLSSVGDWMCANRERVQEWEEFHLSYDLIHHHRRLSDNEFESVPNTPAADGVAISSVNVELFLAETVQDAVQDAVQARDASAEARPKLFVRSARSALFRDGHPALCAHPSGEVQCNRFGAAGLWEEWTVHVLAQPSPSALLVGLRSCHGLWLCAEPCGRVLANRPTLDKSGEWTIERRANGTYAFRSAHGKYLCCLGGAFFGLGDLGHRMCADRERVQEWEEFHLSLDGTAYTYPGSTCRYAMFGTGIALAGVGVLATIGLLSIPALGFGVGGVAAGSAAAGLQSAFYGGATSGIFAALQSIGATAVWAPAAIGCATAGAAGAGIVASMASRNRHALHAPRLILGG